MKHSKPIKPPLTNKKTENWQAAVAGLVLIVLLLPLLTACTSQLPTAEPPVIEVLPTEPELQQESQVPEAEIIFRVEIPGNSPVEQTVTFNLLDEVSGLAINAESYEMIPEDERHYVISLPFTVGSIVKYRYSRQTPSVPVEEHLSDGRQVRYRLFYVQSPGEVTDIISRWTDTPYASPSGRIMGKAIDGFNNQPIPNVLIAAGGAQALTSSDGRFLLEGLPTGVHNLAGYALDGSYGTFQQGALVAAESSTFATITLKPAQTVQVTFEISVPDNTIPAVPIRLAGNLYQLGNTFANLAGGFSTLATRMPVLAPLPDQRYTLSMRLPAGADIRYFYTLGDGFWNTEKTADGYTRQRQLVVPFNDVNIQDTIESWQSGQGDPIVFDITVPENTPTNDSVSIQFNPLFGWTEPIPMWRLGENRWVYILNNPLNIRESLHYRVCRNGQCSVADDSQTAGADSAGYAIPAEADSPKIENHVSSWAWFDPGIQSLDQPVVEITPRKIDFVAGIELRPSFHPSWSPLFPGIIQEINRLGGNWAVLAPTWTFTRNSPPILEISSGRDAFWMDLTEMVRQAKSVGFKLAINPSSNFQSDPADWWNSSPRDFPWWVVWFEQYNNFILHHADLAERTQADALILGGEWVLPALPGGILADGSPSGVPADAESRWRALISEVRTRYSGTILWALPSQQAIENPPAFLDAVDQLYVLFNSPLADQADASQAEFESEAARLIDNGLLPLKLRYDKTLILGIGYPAVDGAAMGCLPDSRGGCLDLQALWLPNRGGSNLTLDLGEQADLYSAILSVINQRDWIDGIISRGYYPPAALQDMSSSIHGKPAQNILEYWYPRLLGTSQ